VAGILWSAIAPPAPFWFGAACSAAAVVLLLTTVKPEPRTQAQPAG
jgi:hypothetical protein